MTQTKQDAKAAFYHSLHYKHQIKQQRPRCAWTYVPGLRLRAEQLCADSSLCFHRLIPFLYSVRVSLYTKSPTSLCRSLQASLCLYGIRCPMTKTKPQGKPDLSGTSPRRRSTRRHTLTFTHTRILTHICVDKFYSVTYNAEILYLSLMSFFFIKSVQFFILF